jgi:hypothetical protein
MRAEQVADVSDDPGELDRLAERLRPSVNRARVLARFDELFRAGTAPDPLPDGFLPGTFLATSMWGPFDSFALALSRVWMPWQGKIFDRERRTGVNSLVQAPASRIVLKAAFPGYSPERGTAERIEAFPFRNRVARGELDRDVSVLKIDYDFEANPDFLIRRILDELVQIAPGRYLGKILFRASGRFHPIGFFSLRSP